MARLRRRAPDQEGLGEVLALCILPGARHQRLGRRLGREILFDRHARRFLRRLDHGLRRRRRRCGFGRGRRCRGSGLRRCRGGRRRRCARDQALQLLAMEQVGIDAARDQDDQHDHRDQPRTGVRPRWRQRLGFGRQARRQFWRGHDQRRRQFGLDRRFYPGLGAQDRGGAAQADQIVGAACGRIDRAGGQHLRPGHDRGADDTDVGFLDAQADRGGAGESIANLGPQVEFQRAFHALDEGRHQPGFGAAPAVIGEMRVGSLLPLQRQRQPIGRRIEIGYAQDRVAGLRLRQDGGAHRHREAFRPPRRAG